MYVALNLLYIYGPLLLNPCGKGIEMRQHCRLASSCNLMREARLLATVSFFLTTATVSFGGSIITAKRKTKKGSKIYLLTFLADKTLVFINICHAMTKGGQINERTKYQILTPNGQDLT